MLLLVLSVALAAPGASVTPFRTEVTPRVDPVFGDTASLRQALDRFLTLHAEMENLRNEFSTAVHGTLAQLVGRSRASTCPPAALARYGQALAAGGGFLALGRQLDARFREIRRADDLGEGAGLTPDYRAKMKRAKEIYGDVLRDYREMRVAFYDQLGAEMRHAGCAPTPRPGRPGPATPDPSDPKAWAFEEDEAGGSEGEGKTQSKAAGGDPPPSPGLARESRKPAPPPGSALAVWITVDNSHCAEPTQLAIDGTVLGAAEPRKKLSVRTRAGPHELCALPTSDKRTCGDPGTIRRAYLYEGWTLVVRCPK